MEEKIIAVMGATGAGKSSFVKLVTECGEIVVAHGLESGTQAIQSYPFQFFGQKIVLVDTPGFDDTYRSDRDTLESLVEWLVGNYKAGTKLSGIIYLHRITDVRVSGSALRNLRVFRDLCGQECFRSIALCATFWKPDVQLQSEQDARLRELTTNECFWAGMVRNGSKVFTGCNSRAEAVGMIYNLLHNETITLQVQREIVHEHKPFQETTASSTLWKLEIERLQQQHNAQLAEETQRYQEDLRQRDRQQSEDLAGMRKAYEEELKKLQKANKRLQAEIDTRQHPSPQIVPNLRNAMPRKAVGSHPKVRRKESRPAMHRSATLEVDEKSLAAEVASRQQQIYSDFATYMTASIRLLEGGQRHGKVKCGFDSRKSCYMMVCVNCMRNIGAGECYKCLDCSGDREFILCTSCYVFSIVDCGVQSHEKVNMVRGNPTTMGTRCPRVLNPPQDAPLICSCCSQDVGWCYLHCCACQEIFDMCIGCAMRGKRCWGSKPLSLRGGHTLEICARYIEPIT